MTSLVLWGGNFIEMNLKQSPAAQQGAFYSRHLSSRSSLPPLGPAQLSPGQTVSGLHPQPPCFLQTQGALCPGLSFTVHPLLAQLGLGAKRTGHTLGGQECITWRRHRKVVNFAQIPLEPRTPNPYLHSPSRTHTEVLVSL